MKSVVALLLAVLSCSPEITPTVSPAFCKDLPCRMTTPINPTSPPTWPLTLTGPNDGEPATAVTVNGPFQSLIDASESARLITYGQTRRYMSVDSANNLSVGPLIAVTLKTGGVWQTYSSTVPITKALVGLVNNTLYNVFVYYSGGLQIQVSLDPVDVTRSFKDGDEGYVFVGYVLTDLVGATVPAKFDGKTYTYLAMGGLGSGVNGNVVLDQGTTSAFVTLNCVPSYAQAANFLFKSVLLTGTDGYFVLTSPAGNQMLVVGLTSTIAISVLQASSPLQTNSVSYSTPNIATGSASIWVLSFSI